jgi:Ner family transcriptional regulator
MHPIDAASIPSDPRIRREWIKYQLAIRGHSLSTLAREHGKTRQQPQAALRKPYPKWERIIADALGLEPRQLWPERYDASGKALRRKHQPDNVMTKKHSTRSVVGRKLATDRG